MTMFGGTIHKLENSLAFASAKNQTIANNIANVDTPNYKAKNVVFKDVLHNEITQDQEAKRTHEKHLPFSNTSGSSYNVVEQRNTSYNHNGNNVDIDKEMAELAKNQIYYQALVDRLNGKFGSIQTAVRGGN
ncbi:flagellar basal body rod protein FlgB [Virgibacillus sp. YIM 98842]|uniref:flagellar basal body rod protein FlgB n=1 Tax=Virgibacillus sp. YIM 98842 TaxID=2663533 RepID=UPI0013DB0605|nr:flagellar basal body rod protein FlgB [Virgibacillus sp. YIM 98842]